MCHNETIMPATLRILLSKAERQHVQQRLTDRKTSQISLQMHTRLRILDLSDQGTPAIQIAKAVGLHYNTVRRFLQRFERDRLAALTNRKPPGRKRRLLEAHWQALEAMLDSSERTFTSGQIAAWLQQQFGYWVNTVYLSQKLRSRGWRYKRTKRSLDAKKPPAPVVEVAAQQLASLKKAGAGWVRGSSLS